MMKVKNSNQISEQQHEWIRQHAKLVLPDCDAIKGPTISVSIPAADGFIELRPGTILYYECTFAKMYSTLSSLNTTEDRGYAPMIGWRLEFAIVNRIN